MGNTCCLVCACVDQASVGVVERWGRFEKLAEPGLHFFNPLAGQWLVGVLSTRIRSLDVRIETKTKVALPPPPFSLNFIYICFESRCCSFVWSPRKLGGNFKGNRRKGGNFEGSIFVGLHLFRSNWIRVFEFCFPSNRVVEIIGNKDGVHSVPFHLGWCMLWDWI